MRLRCGRSEKVRLARGDATIDVWADDHSSPPNILAVECKHWVRRATKSVVHAFRTVVGDSGANTGLIVSLAGFQKGAIRAAAYSNVRLLDWNEFQEMFATRWFRSHMSRMLSDHTDALHEYTEPINARISRKAQELASGKRELFDELRQRYAPLAAVNMMFYPEFRDFLAWKQVSQLPDLPLRAQVHSSSGAGLIDLVPDDILDATALRPLMDALVEHSRLATAEFDEIFGGRA